MPEPWPAPKEPPAVLLAEGPGLGAASRGGAADNFQGQGIGVQDVDMMGFYNGILYDFMVISWDFIVI